MFDTLKALFGWPWWSRRKPAPAPTPPKPLPTQERDVPYGPDPLQKLDVDRPAGMVEGDTATTAGFDLSHGDMDAMVGKPGPLTDAIDKFLG